MTEEVWRHALHYLDTFRSGQHGDDISGLYQVEDTTGVMARHKEKLMAAFLDHQVDMKIMYYELIKMLMEHEKEQLSEEEYHVTKTVHKIEGYQQLTNKLQRFMNQKFVKELADVTNKIEGISTNVGNINVINKIDILEQNLSLLQTENKMLAEKLASVESHSTRFSEDFRLNMETKLEDLAGTKERLEKTIEMIGDNKTVLNSLIEKTDKHQDNIDYLMKAVNDSQGTKDSIKDVKEAFKKYEVKVDTLEKQCNVTDDRVSILNENFDKLKDSIEDNQNKLSNVINNIEDVSEKQSSLEKTLHDCSDEIAKNASCIKTMEAGVEDLETRTTETVERMREVMVITANIENSVNNIQEKFEQQNKETFSKINDNIQQLADIRTEVDGFKDKVNSQQSGLERSLEILGDDFSKHYNAQKSSIKKLDDELKGALDKVLLLEEGHNTHEGRMMMMETLGSRLTMVEERKQESDVTDARNRHQLEQQMEEVQDKIRSLQETIASVRTSVTDNRDHVDTALVELRQATNQSTDRLTELSVVTNEMRTSVYQEIQTRLQERMTEVTLMVQEVETKNKDVGQVVKEEYRQDMKRVEEQLNTIYLDYDKITKALEDFQQKHNEDIESLEIADRKLGESVESTDKKMEKIIDQTSTLLVNDARQDDALAKMEDRVRTVEGKCDSLEEADKYLQESLRQNTDNHENLEIFVKKSIEDLELKIVAASGVRKNVDDIEKNINAANDQLEELKLLFNQSDSDHKILESKLLADIDSLQQANAHVKDTLGNLQEDISEKIDSIRSKEDSLDSGLQSMLNTSNNFSNDIENVEDEVKKLQETLIQLEFKLESPKMVESLSAELSQLHEEKETAEAKTAANIESLTQKLENLAQEHEKATVKIQDVDNYAQGVNIKVEELENSLEGRVSEVSEKVESLEKTTGERSENLKREIREKLEENTTRSIEKFEIIERGLRLHIEEVEKYNYSTKEKFTNIEDEQTLIVARVGGQGDSLESLEAKFKELQEQMSSNREEEVREWSRTQIQSVKEDVESKFGDLHNMIGDINSTLSSTIISSKKSQTTGEGLMTVTLEMYSAFNGSCLVLKASRDSMLAEHQPQVVGVYRLVDSYNERPVFKQDMGENYIYYSLAGQSWVLGCQVGHTYCLLRNRSKEAAGARWPSLLSRGWQVRSRGSQEWLDHEGTMVSPVRDVDRIREIIRDMKMEKEI